MKNKKSTESRDVRQRGTGHKRIKAPKQKSGAGKKQKRSHKLKSEEALQHETGRSLELRIALTPVEDATAIGQPLPMQSQINDDASTDAKIHWALPQPTVLLNHDDDGEDGGGEGEEDDGWEEEEEEEGGDDDDDCN
ncbi:hypothetical protein AK812_SmicGene2456 [Symbiodinium microadriaticum]|uniref:Uncharacterized protein n=1 Tax=Symbiodinium microadriaticum TaxID=2951 RepID=A0A1Q9F1E9_SYMMI|nr:hypothetical protein AK812_SmicGene2456 [Symbiodinium microadriaticum]